MEATQTPVPTQPAPTTEAAPVEPKVEETPKVETAVEETPKEPEVKEDKLSSRFAALTKKERAIRQREMTIKEQMRQVEQMKAEAESLLNKKKAAKLNPAEWLSEAGLTYDEITQYFLNDKKPSVDSKVDVVRQENEALRKELQEWKAFQERQKTETLINGFKQQINSFVSSSEKHELIKTLDQQEIVYNVIDQHAAETGRLMSIEEACDIVESYLEEQEQDRLQKLLKTKIGNKVQPKAEPKKEQAQTSEAKTLGNTSESSPRLETELDPEKRKKLAAQLLKFE